MAQKLLSFVSLSSCRRDETRRADGELNRLIYSTVGSMGLTVVSAGGGDGGGVTADREARDHCWRLSSNVCEREATNEKNSDRSVRLVPQEQLHQIHLRRATLHRLHLHQCHHTHTHTHMHSQQTLQASLPPAAIAQLAAHQTASLLSSPHTQPIRKSLYSAPHVSTSYL